MTEWKPEKNITSPWDVDVWENNIGQPVSNTYIQPQGTLYIGRTKWYDIDTNKITSIKDVKALFDAIGLKVSETNENFDKVKHLLIVPEQPKTLDEISQEFDEKIDNLIEVKKEKEMIRQNLKTSLKELANGDVRPIDDVIEEAKEQQTKSPTLYELIADWWDEIFMNNNEAAVTIESLVEQIEREWLQKEHDTNSYKWNQCIRMIREKLR